MELSLTEATAALYRSRAAAAQRRIDQDLAVGRQADKHDTATVARNLRLAEATEATDRSWPPVLHVVMPTPRGWRTV